MQTPGCPAAPGTRRYRRLRSHAESVGETGETGSSVIALVHPSAGSAAISRADRENRSAGRVTPQKLCVDDFQNAQPAAPSMGYPEPVMQWPVEISKTAIGWRTVSIPSRGPQES